MKKLFSVFFLVVFVQLFSFSITFSGTIKTATNNPVEDVTLTLVSGLNNTNVITNEFGEYSIPAIAGVNYILTPQKNGYSFSPESRIITNVFSDAEFNFTASLNAVQISGKVSLDNSISLADVTINYTEGVGPSATNNSTLSNSNGEYSFEATANTPIVIVPEKLGYSFYPEFHQENQGFSTNEIIDFVATPTLLSVSGTVITELGDPIENTMIIATQFSNDKIFTDALGHFELFVSPNDNIILIALHGSYSFQPTMYDIKLIEKDTILQFVGSQKTKSISGNVFSKSNIGVEGIDIIIAGSVSDTLKTDINGRYQFEGLEGYPYGILPFKKGYTFMPETFILESLVADTLINFVSELVVPELKSPGSGEKDVFPSVFLTWSHPLPENEVKFNIQVFQGGELIREAFSLTEEEYLLENLSPSTNYRWCVQALTSSDTSAWSMKQLFTSSNNAEILSIIDLDPQIQLGDKKPLILLHGWNFNGRPAAPSDGYWNNFINYFNTNIQLKETYKIYKVRYYSNITSINDLSFEFCKQLETVGLHEQSIVLMGHSMGGLICRSYMNEQNFQTGINAGKKCGDVVSLLITLGTPHHGSPLANGPSRTDGISEALTLPLMLLDEALFMQTSYDKINRSELHWDNYDGLFDYSKYPDEENAWLNALNNNDLYESKTVVYAGTIDGDLSLPINSNEDKYKTGSYLINSLFGMENDGIVPLQSATFDQHSMKDIRIYEDYNHDEIVSGKSTNTVLFDQISYDLLDVTPLKIVYPTNSGIVLKHDSVCTIQWTSPDDLANVNIYISYDNGETYNEIISNIDGQLDVYNWKIPLINTDVAFIIIEASKPNGEISISNKPFSIYNEQIELIQPNTEVFKQIGDRLKIEWNHRGVGSHVQLKYVDSKNNIEELIRSDFEMLSDTSSIEWEIPATIASTDSAFIQIEILNMDTEFSDFEEYLFHSEYFTVYTAPTVKLLKPAFYTDEFGQFGEHLEIDSIYMIEYETTGLINLVHLYLCDKDKNVIDTIGLQENTHSFLTESTFEWLVPERYGNDFFLFIEGSYNGDSICADDYTDYKFRINRTPQIINPLPVDTTVSILPCFEMRELPDFIGYNFRIIGNNYDKSFVSSTATFCLPKLIENELSVGTNYELHVQANFSKNEKSYIVKRKFKTENVLPGTFELRTPKNGTLIASDNTLFEWSSSFGANGYDILLTKAGETFRYKNDIAKTDTSYQFPLGENHSYSDTIFWEVTAKNNVGELTQEGFFFKVSLFQEIGNYSIYSDSWTDIGDGKLEAKGSFNIRISENFDHLYHKDIVIDEGKIVINKNENVIESAEGKVYFREGIDIFKPIFEGSFSFDSINLIPIDYSLTIEENFLPDIPISQLELVRWNLVNYKIRFECYPSSYTLNYPGVKLDKKNDFTIEIYDIEIHKDGRISGNVKDLTISMGMIRYELSEVYIAKSDNDNTLYVIANKVRTMVINNDFFKSDKPSGYGSPLAFKLNGDNIGFVGIDENDQPHWDNISAFPDIQIANTSLVAPFCNFMYFENEQKWGLDMQAMLKFPWVSAEETFIGDLLWYLTPIPMIEARFSYLNAPPYIKEISAQASNLSSVGLSLGIGSAAGFGVGVTPYWQLLGFGGKYTMQSSPEGKFQNLSLLGDVTIGFGPKIKNFHILSVTGTAMFDLVTRPKVSETFTINGDAKLFMYVNLANASVSLSSMQSRKFSDILLKGNATVAFPTINKPIIYGDVSLLTQMYVAKSNNYIPALDARLTGELRVKLEKNLVDYKGIKWPKNSTTLSRMEVKFGKVKSTGGKVGFAFNYQKSFTYPVSVDCKVTLSEPYLNCDIEWKRKLQTIGCFFPADKSTPQFGFERFTLVKFEREKSARLKSAGLEIKGVKMFQVTENYDSLVINIPPQNDEFIDFSVTYSGNVRPVVLLREPEGGYYSSEMFLEQNPDMEGTDGFVLTLPYAEGNWSIIVPNANEVSDYKIEALGGIPLAQTVFNKVEINSDGKLNVSCSYSNSTNDSTAVQFFFSETDSTDGKLLSDQTFSFDKGQLVTNFDISHIEPGNYFIYASIDDGLNMPQKTVTTKPIYIDFSGTLNAPSQFQVVRGQKSYIFKWNSPNGSNGFEFYLGEESGAYNDTLYTNIAQIEIPVNSLKDNAFYAVRSKSFNQRLSDFSVEQVFSSTNYTIDTIAPNIPEQFEVDLNLEGDLNGSFATFSWNRVSDAIGYVLQLRESNDSSLIYLDVDSLKSINYYPLEKGLTYYVSVKAYDLAQNISNPTDEVMFNFFYDSDTDADGIIDDKEILYFGSIDVESDPNNDPDGDGISTKIELVNGTNPNSKDSDNDLIWDDVDEHPLSAHDNDNDFMADDWETYYKVSLPNEDPDNDGLSNKDEYRNATNPNVSDTDKGGMNDGREVELGLNPNNRVDDVEEADRIITELNTFSATHYADSVQVNWETIHEDLLSFFNIYRRYSESENWTQINNEPIRRIQSSSTSNNYYFIDNNIDSIPVVYYMIEAISESESVEELFEISVIYVEKLSNIPIIDEVETLCNYPNPFNTKTIITFNILQSEINGNALISIYNSEGKLIHEIHPNVRSAGLHSVEWNAKNSTGEDIPNGMYIYQLRVNNRLCSRKMLLLK